MCSAAYVTVALRHFGCGTGTPSEHTSDDWKETPASSNRVTALCRRSWNRQITFAALRAVFHPVFSGLVCRRHGRTTVMDVLVPLPAPL
jgi:hypothetical protein